MGIQVGLRMPSHRVRGVTPSFSSLGQHIRPGKSRYQTIAMTGGKVTRRSETERLDQERFARYMTPLKGAISKTF